MLCHSCARLPFHDATWTRAMRHCRSYLALVTSALRGCGLCSLFRRALLDYHADHHSHSVDEAERFEWSLDKRNGRRGNDDDTPASPLEDEPPEGFPPGSFLVWPMRTNMRDDHSAPKGISSLAFRRRPHGHDDCVFYSSPRLYVSCAPGGIAQHKWCIVGRENTIQADIELARSLIEDCDSSHVECLARTSPSFMPHRLLDLGPLPPTSSALTSDLRLVINPETAAPYITLSHRWGGTKPLLLLQSVYAAFQDSIAFADLPATFQDAVRATRLLGVHYLWIDSLCIIQDSPRDWEVQCKWMGRIYASSWLTIAGPAADGCGAGFLHPRRPGHHVRRTVTDAEGDTDEIALSHRAAHSQPIHLRPEEDRQLSTRGWVLQERLLSTRVLYFGQWNMYLECLTDTRADSWHAPITCGGVSADVPKQWLVDTQQGDDVHDPDQFVRWTDLVSAYSRLLLTQIGDRLPALGGLAAAFHSATGATYLAGLWRAHLPWGLVWYVPPSYEPEPISASSWPDGRKPPSWSWASANVPVDFLLQLPYWPLHPDIVIHNATTTPTGPDPYGMVSGGRIDCEGRVRDLTVRRDANLYFGGKRRHNNVISVKAEADTMDLAVFASDDPKEAKMTLAAGDLRMPLLYLGVLKTGFGERGFTRPQGPYGFVVAMGLRRVQRSGAATETFERTGLAFTQFDVEDSGAADSFRALFNDVPRRRLSLV